MQASVVKVSGSAAYGSDANNPLASASGDVELGTASAQGDMLMGDDGKRVGLALGGDAGAALVSATGSAGTNIPIPFTSWTIGIQGQAGGSLAGVGGGAEVHAYYDTAPSNGSMLEAWGMRYSDSVAC